MHSSVRARCRRCAYETELVAGAGAIIRLAGVSAGPAITGIFSVPASIISACAKCLRALVDWAPAPLAARHRCAHRTADRTGLSTGFVFKIQANMDPNHRGRIAFLRRLLRPLHLGYEGQTPRTGKEMKLANAVTFMANERTRMDEGLRGRHHRACTITASCRSAMC